MLIVGDAAMPDVEEKDIEYIEIIVKEDNIESLKKKLNIEGVTSLSISKHSRLYFRKKDNRRFILHNTAHHFQMNRLLELNSATDQIKLATPSMNYVYLWTLQNTKFKNALMWANKLKQIKKLRYYFERDFAYKPDNLKFRHFGKYINHYLRQLNIVSSTPFSYSDFEYFNKHELINVISTQKCPNKAYNRMTVPHIDHFYIENIFVKTFTDSQRHSAIMDKLYIDTINEYFVPEIIIDEKFPVYSKWKELFAKSMMNTYLHNSNEHNFFRDYIYNNINNILKDYNAEPFKLFIEAYHKKSLKIKK